MIQIETLDDEMLLSTIPDAITINTSEASVDVCLLIDGKSIFDTTLYTYQGKVKFVGFVTLIRDYCEEHGTPLVTFQLTARTERDEGSTAPKQVLYCRHFNTGHDDAFLAQHFLSTRSTFLLPRTKRWQLSWVTMPGEACQSWMDCVMKKDGVTSVYKLTGQSFAAVDKYTLHIADLVPADIEEAAQKACGTDATLCAVTAHWGQRIATFFITDEEPSVAFRFRNTFSAVEYAYLFAATTTKLEEEHSEAECLGTAAFYDRSTEESHEVATSNLTYEEAMWLKQLLVAPEVAVAVLGTDAYWKVLVSDIHCEISDDTNATNSIKFTWKFEQKMDILPEMKTKRIFTEQYNHVFY